ncbi:MAG: 30S ribosomal protein S4 [Candidatus Heimdallarchaeaceae archaeon]|jgi:small subunit ribosomal protein S4
MGGIKRQRKKIITPGHPYDKARLDRELPLVGEYGLRNKKELWKARTILSKARQQARGLLALDPDIRTQRENELLSRLSRFGMLQKGSDLDSVLALDVRTVLDRRLQTIVFRKGLASSPYQARQFIAHRHIAINGGVVTSPGMMVTVKDEEELTYAPRSPLNDTHHPARPQAPPTIPEFEAEKEKLKPEEAIAPEAEELEPVVEKPKPAPKPKKEAPPKEKKPEPTPKPKPEPKPKVKEEKPPEKKEVKTKVETIADLSNLDGVGAKTAMLLQDHGFKSINKIAETSVEDLSQVPGIGKATAEKIIKNAKDYLKKSGGKK